MYTPRKTAFTRIGTSEKAHFIIFTQKVQKNYKIWLILYSLTSDDVPVQRKRGYAFSYGGGLKFNDPEVERADKNHKSNLGLTPKGLRLWLSADSILVVKQSLQ